MGKKLTRRDFIKLSAVGLAATGAAAATARIIAIPPDTGLPDPYPVVPPREPVIPSPSGSTRFFNDHQYALVATLAALIVPTDEDPGATEAGAVEYVDELVAESEGKQAAYAEGLAWLDEYSQEKYDGDFLSLGVGEQIDLLRSAYEADAVRNRSVSGFLEQVDRKIDKIWDDLVGVGDVPKLFLRYLRRDVLYGYYSNPVSWNVVGYYGPPQPVGYPDYAEPPSASADIDRVRPVEDETCQSCHFDQTMKEGHVDSTECTACHTPHISSEGGN
jgi:gluconate 2-dehydrogenase gamma chain